MEGNSVFYEIKELEKNILKHLAKPMTDKEIENKITYKPTPTQMRIVDYMLDNIDKEYIYQKDIEEALRLSKATVSDVLNRMEKNGLIERNTNPVDTRSKTIILSKDAKEKYESSKKRLLELEKKAEKNITNEELKIFSDVLNKMKKNLEEEQEQ